MALLLPYFCCSCLFFFKKYFVYGAHKSGNWVYAQIPWSEKSKQKPEQKLISSQVCCCFYKWNRKKDVDSKILIGLLHLTLVFSVHMGLDSFSTSLFMHVSSAWFIFDIVISKLSNTYKHTECNQFPAPCRNWSIYVVSHLCEFEFIFIFQCLSASACACLHSIIQKWLIGK